MLGSLVGGRKCYGSESKERSKEKPFGCFSSRQLRRMKFNSLNTSTSSLNKIKEGEEGGRKSLRRKIKEERQLAVKTKGG